MKERFVKVVKHNDYVEYLMMMGILMIGFGVSIFGILKLRLSQSLLELVSICLIVAGIITIINSWLSKEVYWEKVK